MGKQTDEDGTTSAASVASSDESNTGSKGSSHHLGAAIGGAITKISSPIGTGIRKVVRHDSSSSRHHHKRDKSDVSSSPAAAANNKTKSVDNGEKQTPIRDVADFFGEGGKAVKRLVHHKSKDSSSRSVPDNEEKDDEDDSDLPAVPPDETLEKMNVIINKRLKNVSIPQYYETVWSGDSGGALYRSFLKDSGKEDIVVGDWEVADDDTDFLGDWDGEKYQKKRTVTFVFDKKIPMQSKPVVAQVKQTHYCRMEGKDKCVASMTIDMDGVPFSDCFVVEVRWVASRSGKNDVSIQVGLFVNFVKSTMLSGKIRSGTTEQTTQSQMILFNKVQAACGATAEEVQEKEAPPPPPSTPKLSQEEAGRILILVACLLLLASQAECLFIRDATNLQVSSSAVTSALAGLLLIVSNVCQMSENECLLVVVAHLVHGLSSSLASNAGFVTSVSTVLLMAAWAVLAWRVLQQGTPSKSM